MKFIKFSFIIIFLVLICDCQCQDVDKDQNLASFEKLLPSNDLKLLNQWSVLYENFLQESYGENNEQSELQFLEDIINNDVSRWRPNKLEICKCLSKTENSTLEYKIEKLKFDTVYASNYYKMWDSTYYSEDPVIITIDQKGDTSWQDIIIPGERTVENLINYVRAKGYFETISKSSFRTKLREANISDPFVKGYLNEIRLVGKKEYNSLAAFIEVYIKKFGHNEIIRKIIIFDVFREFFSESKYGC